MNALELFGTHVTSIGEPPERSDTANRGTPAERGSHVSLVFDTQAIHQRIDFVDGIARRFIAFGGVEGAGILAAAIAEKRTREWLEFRLPACWMLAGRKGTSSFPSTRHL
jgi:hypothetical protein